MTVSWNRECLSRDVHCDRVPSLTEYVADLEATGFVDVVATDVSEDWRSFTHERAAAFQANRDSFLAVTHGREDVYERLKDFYVSVASLFAGGRLGGVIVTARRP